MESHSRINQNGIPVNTHPQPVTLVLKDSEWGIYYNINHVLYNTTCLHYEIDQLCKMHAWYIEGHIVYVDVAFLSCIYKWMTLTMKYCIQKIDIDACI